ncbi:anti-phage protein KwaB [Carboxylicivirga marina]|uniref:anti-phage protein KwaB n=1 Tax=Carboxylicivirga marina TaxID=2800988 RepID=UPI002599F8A3|nr:anti-phage protein KwaB [uncultured Carboxylicivirga sp.]
MNLDELRDKIETISQMDAIGLNVFFVLKTDEGNVLKRANLIEEVKNSLIEAYKESLDHMVANEDLALINLSDADDRNSAIYLYDLEHQPGIFSFFDDINNRDEENPIPYFSFNDDKLTDLEGYFVSIGDFENNILVYRKQMPINLFKQGKIYIVKGHDTQFERIDKEFLRIDTKLDVLQVDESIIINNISILERHYEFKDIIEHEANTSLENIDNLEILENIEVLQERVEDVAFARKLSKISTTSPVFNFPSDHIMEFVRTHQTLGNEFRYSEDQNRILLDTKKSQNFFLRLMNDDFLHSQLTDFDYMTPAKDRLN